MNHSQTADSVNDTLVQFYGDAKVVAWDAKECCDNLWFAGKAENRMRGNSKASLEGNKRTTA